MDRRGGSLAALEFITAEIDESAWSYAERYRTGQDIVVGVNRYVEDEPRVEQILRVDPQSERDQGERLAAFRQGRDGEALALRLVDLREAAAGTANLLPPIRAALRDRATLGEVCATLGEVFGSYRPAF